MRESRSGQKAGGGNGAGKPSAGAAPSPPEQLSTNRLETLGRLALGVAHDLNNLLTVILTCCSALGQSDTPEDQREGHVREIEQTCRRAAALTQQLLAFGRPAEAGRSSFDLNQVLIDAESMLRRLLPSGVELRVGLCRQPAIVKADRVQIQQILLNLVLNSRDAMPDGGSLAIELRPTEGQSSPGEKQKSPAAAPHHFFELKVSDTGRGIPEEMQPKVFEPFVTTKSSAGGTGLGLSTVAEIVKRHGGSIDLSSQNGSGTTFVIRLPAEDPARGPEERSPGRKEKICGGETVLLVEDDAHLCESLRRVLREAGYRVLVAKDTDTAARIASEHPAAIHLLLADSDISRVQASGFVDGLQTFQPGMRVLYTATRGAAAPSGPAGSQEPAILKPFDSRELLGRVKQILEKSASRRLALVIDEDPAWRDAARRPLQDRGYTVVAARSRDEAFQWLEKKRFDLCVVQLDGSAPRDASVVKQIRERCPSSVSIVATGDFHANLLQAARSLGADAVMQKPYSRDDFLLILDTYLDRSNGKGKTTPNTAAG